jgi:phage recombination protein Bet
MSTSIAKLPQSQPVGRFTPSQIELIKRTICKGANDDELRMFLYQCDRTGLDPFARQIYSIERREMRNGQWATIRSIQTSIDGFRLVAERSQKYSGQLGPFWCDETGQWQDVWIVSTPPAAAKVGVLRNDFKEPCWGVARFDAYAQKTKEGKPTRMWANMPDVMIAKCAEALALRKAFPQELSGLYTSDEMDQAQPVQEIPHHTPPTPQPDIIIDPETGEVTDEKPSAPPISLHDLAREAAKRGKEPMKKFYLSRSKAEKKEIDKIKPELDDLVDAAEKATTSE